MRDTGTPRRFAWLAAVGAIAAALAGCASDSLSRGVYDGAQVYNESLKSTPMEKSSRGDPESYDRYEKERQKPAAGGR